MEERISIETTSRIPPVGQGATGFACRIPFFLLSFALLLFAWPLRATAQDAAQAASGPTSAAKLPLSNSTALQSSVTVNQRTTNAGGGNSVNVIESSVSTQAPYSGSVPSGAKPGGAYALTLTRALELGLRYNLGAINQAQQVMQARGERDVARSQLLPNLNAGLAEELEKLNLRTFGVESSQFPVSTVFNFFDARAARLNQTIFDLVKIENLHSASENVQVNLKAARNARDLIVLAVAGGYLELIETEARLSAASAEVESSKAVAQQAEDRFVAGTAARIDAMRSTVQLQTEEQRLRSLEADLDTQKLRMARMIGLPLDQDFTIAEQYRYAPLDDLAEPAALARAMQQRSDLQAARAGARAAEDALKAARAERLPNVAVTADWGIAGLRPSSDTSTVYTVAGTLTVPLWEGGRIHGDIEQATAVLRARQADLENMRGQVEEDVRQAFIDLNSAADQVSVASSNRDLARETLEQSRDRFTQGVADTVELVQAEQTVVQADDDYIAAVYEHNLAKISLARAMGNAEQTLPQLLKK